MFSILLIAYLRVKLNGEKLLVFTSNISFLIEQIYYLKGIT